MTELRQAMPHQEVALAKLIPRAHAPNFMDMRLGKSLVTLRWAMARGVKLALLVAPELPMMDWASEAELEHWDFVRIRGTPKQRAWQIDDATKDPLFQGRRMVAISYGTLRHSPEIALVPWECVILDESTTIKNPLTKTFKMVMRWFKGVPNRAVLSGYPCPQSELEIFAQMAFVQDGSFMGCDNYWTWRERYFHQFGFEFMPRKGALLKIKEAVHEAAVVMSKADAGLKRHVERTRLTAPLDPLVAHLQRDVIKTWASEEWSTNIAAVVSGRLEMLAGGHGPNWEPLPCWKYQALVEFVQNAPPEPIVVWAKYNAELLRAAAALEAAGVPCAVLNGDVPAEERRTLVDAFRKGAFRVLLCQPALVRYGIDLSNSDVSVYLSCSYSSEARKQSEERTSHPKKDAPTMVVDMVTEDSSDIAVMDSLAANRSDAAWFLSRVKNLFQKKAV